eukprot:gene18927-6284_t
MSVDYAHKTTPTKTTNYITSCKDSTHRMPTHNAPSQERVQNSNSPTNRRKTRKIATTQKSPATPIHSTTRTNTSSKSPSPVGADPLSSPTPRVGNHPPSPNDSTSLKTPKPILTPSTQEDQTSQSTIQPASNQTIPQTSQLTDDSQLNLTINTPPICTHQVAFGQGDTFNSSLSFMGVTKSRKDMMTPSGTPKIYANDDNPQRTPSPSHPLASHPPPYPNSHTESEVEGRDPHIVTPVPQDMWAIPPIEVISYNPEHLALKLVRSDGRLRPKDRLQ